MITEVWNYPVDSSTCFWTWHCWVCRVTLPIYESLVSLKTELLTLDPSLKCDTNLGESGIYWLNWKSIDLKETPALFTLLSQCFGFLIKLTIRLSCLRKQIVWMFLECFVIVWIFALYTAKCSCIVKTFTLSVQQCAKDIRKKKAFRWVWCPAIDNFVV